MLWVVAVLLVMHRSSHLVPGFVGGLGSEGMIGSRVEPERFGGANPALGWGILEVVNPNPNPNRKHGSELRPPTHEVDRQT